MSRRIYNGIVDGIMENIHQKNYIFIIFLLLFILSFSLCLIYQSTIGNVYIFVSFLAAFFIGAYLFDMGSDWNFN